MEVSALSYGASSVSNVFQEVNETEAIRAVHTALDLGINYIDVVPAYGGTRSEMVLGKALKGISRSSYFLSTTVGKYTNPGQYGDDTHDYSGGRILQSLDESAVRLGTDYFDIIHIHDIEYQGRKHTEWALSEGYESLVELKRKGRIGAVSFGIYPIDLWRRNLETLPIDAGLVHNHYSLHDNRLLELLPLARKRGIGLINASSFGSGLLTDRGPAIWHNSNTEQRAIFRKAAKFCKDRKTSISKLAMQFSNQNPDIWTTMFSSSNPASVIRNVEWALEPCDPALARVVQSIPQPVINVDWF